MENSDSDTDTLAAARLYEMKYACTETRYSTEVIELRKHSRTDSDVKSQFIIDK